MYEIGLLIAFLMWAWTLVMIPVRSLSQTERNLRKIGMRHSWLTGTPKPMSSGDFEPRLLNRLLKLGTLLLLGAPWVLLSWAYVAFVGCSTVYLYMKDRGAPQEIREFRWRMRNLELSFDEMVAGIHMINKDGRSFEDVRQSIVEMMDEMRTA